MIYNEIKKGKRIKSGTAFFGTLIPYIPIHLHIVLNLMYDRFLYNSIDF